MNVEFVVSNWRQIKAQSLREKIWCGFCVGSVLFISVALISFFTLSKSAEKVCRSSECSIASHHMITFMNQSADPCMDFYAFSCGGFHNEVHLRDKKTVVDELTYRTKQILGRLVMEKRYDEEKLTDSFRELRQYYRGCMNLTRLNETTDYIYHKDYVDRAIETYIDTSQDLASDWTKTDINAKRQGFQYDFFLRVDVYKEADSGRAYLLVETPKLEQFNMKIWTMGYRHHLLLLLRGDPKNAHKLKLLNDAIYFARKMYDILTTANTDNAWKSLKTKKIKIGDIKNSPNLTIDWKTFLTDYTGLELNDNDVIIFNIRMSYFEDVINLFANEITDKPESWLTYVRLAFIAEDCPLLPYNMRILCQNATLSNWFEYSREKFCLNEIDTLFPRAVEVQYIRQYTTPEIKEKVTEMLFDLKVSIEDYLTKTKFSDEQSQNSALDYLRSIKVGVGWKDIVFDVNEYDRLFGYYKNQLGKTILRSRHNLYKAHFENKFKMAMAKQSSDRHKFSIPNLEEIRTYFDQTDNTIVVPVTLLQEPLYVRNRPEYINYGSLGKIIGQELMRRYVFNLTKINETWKINLEKSRSKDMVCVEHGYSRRASVWILDPDKMFDSIWTDFGSVNVAYQAYKKWTYRHGTEPQLTGINYDPKQLFWISTNTYMCKYLDASSGSSLLIEDKPLSSYRVNGPAMNSPFFGSDFRCPPNSFMNPTDKCYVFV